MKKKTVANIDKYIGKQCKLLKWSSSGAKRCPGIYVDDNADGRLGENYSCAVCPVCDDRPNAVYYGN